MKNLKKIVFTVFFAGLLLFAFSACDKALPKLSAPENLEISGTTLAWGEVKDATGYIISIDGTEYNSETAVFSLSNLTGLKLYQIKVKAKGDRVNYDDSTWSAVKEYDTRKLSAPKNLTLTADGLTWNEVENASGYVVTLDGVSYNTETALYSLSELTLSKVYRLRVKAKGDGVSYLDSSWSKEKEYAIGTEGLLYTQTEGGYAVSIGTATAEDVIISSFHNGEPVVGIAEDGFTYSSLKTIYIPDSMTGIGSFAFYNCNSLTSINIPGGVTSIGVDAFSGCSALINVVILDGVTSIGVWMFNNCNSLTSIHIPDSVTDIGYGAFRYCSSLTSIIIPDGVTSIGDSAFFECNNLTSIVIPDSVISIGDGAFYNCNNLTSIVIPDGVTSIGDGTFFYCYNLTSIVIPDSVTSIGDSAFSSCTNLTSINIPDSVTSIGDYAFNYCTSLTSINISGSVTSIGEFAFSKCTSLTSINIPDSVTSIGDGAFYYCSNLTIYTEFSSQPSGWSYYWNYTNSPVVWGCELSEDKTFVVSFTKTASTPGILSAPHREGYTFGGWVETPGGAVIGSIYFVPDGTTLYSVWNKTGSY